MSSYQQFASSPWRRAKIGEGRAGAPKITEFRQTLGRQKSVPGQLAMIVAGQGPAYIWATLAVGVAGLIAATVERVLSLPNLSLVFLSAVLLVAVRLGTAPALYAAGLGLAAYNFFFTAPYFTLSVYDRADVLTLLFFVLVALLTGNLAGRLRSQLEAARESAKRTHILYDFSRKVADAMGIDEVLDAISRQASATFGVRAVVFLAHADGPGGLTAASAYPLRDGASDDDRVAAERAWRKDGAPGCAAESTTAATYFFAPMRTGHGAIGLVGLASPPDRAGLSSEQRRLFESLADQSAVAIERARLAADIEKARLRSESESLRAALLSSVSHDLRTPLASIVGSATALASVWESLSPADRRDLTDTILEESNRLNRLVQNLLDMTRIGHGNLTPRRDWVDLREIVGRAVYRMREPLLRFHTIVTIGDDVPLLHLDPVLIEQVVVNILDNSAKHAPTASTISVTAARRGSTVEVRIEDEGPGIALKDRVLVFDMFFRTKVEGGRVSGNGLGLSICKGFVEAHGGTISAEAAAGGSGAAIVVTVPIQHAPLVKAG